MSNYGLFLYGGISGGYMLEILQKDFEGDAVAIELFDSSPLSFSGMDDRSIGELPLAILKSSLTIKVRDMGGIDYSTFFTSDSTRYLVRLYEGGSVVWTGFLTPDSYETTFAYKTAITLVARDNLGYLDQLDFDYFDSDFVTLREVLNMAIERASFAMSVTFDDITYIDAGSSNVLDASVSVEIFRDGTWWDALETLFTSLGMQFRYVGGNTFKVVTQGETYNVGNGEFDLVSLRDVGTKSIVPSWREVKVEQDFGLIDAYPSNGLKSKNYEYFGYDENVGEVFRLPAQAGQGVTPSTNEWRESDAGSQKVLLVKPSERRISGNVGEVIGTELYSEDYNKFLYLTTLNSSETGESDSYIMYPFFFNGLHNGVVQVKYNLSSALYRAYGNSLGVVNSLPVEGVFTLFRVKLLYLTWDNEAYYFTADGWSRNTFDWEIITFEHEVNQSTDSGGTTTFTVNVVSFPQKRGELQVCVLPPYSDNTPRVLRLDNVTCTFEEARNSSLTTAGLLNEGGNVSQDIDVQIGEVPQNKGDYLSYIGGLFDNSKYHTALTGWRRSDNLGGAMHLSELVGRSYAHLFNSFVNTNGEKIGGSVIEATIDFKSIANFAMRFDVNGKKYILTSAQCDLKAKTASVMLREVTPYKHEEEVYTEELVDTGGGITLGSGNNSLITWGDGANEIKRITDLPQAIDIENSYMIVDDGGAEGAKKYPARNFGDFSKAFRLHYEGEELKSIEALGILWSERAISSNGYDPTEFSGGGGTGGISMSDVWIALASGTQEQINVSHLTTALSGYATQQWVSQQDYVNSTELLNALSPYDSSLVSVGFVPSTGVFTFARIDGSSFTINTLLEKVVTNFEYNSTTKSLELTLEDGTVQSVPMSDFIDIYIGQSTSTIDVAVSQSNVISASLRSGSVAKSYLASALQTEISNATNNITTLQSYFSDGKAKEALDSERLGGQLPSYYATQTGAESLSERIAFFEALIGKDADGNVYIKEGRNFYTEGANSSGGYDPTQGSGGGGIDMSEVWDALGSATQEQINVSHLSTALSGYVKNDLQIIAGNGLTGGGALTANRTLTLGTPTTISVSSTNSVGASTHSHYINRAGIGSTGIVALTTSLATTSNTIALAGSVGKTLNDKIISLEDFIKRNFLEESIDGENILKLLKGTYSESFVSAGEYDPTSSGGGASGNAFGVMAFEVIDPSTGARTMLPIQADTPDAGLSFLAGDGITFEPDAENGFVKISASGGGMTESEMWTHLASQSFSPIAEQIHYSHLSSAFNTLDIFSMIDVYELGQSSPTQISASVKTDKFTLRASGSVSLSVDPVTKTITIIGAK